MIEARKLASRVEAAIKRADTDVIIDRAFYDDISDRLYINVVKGSRKTEIMLTIKDEKEIDRLVEQGLLRLRNTPIG